jgi:type II secretory pathway pseudopilin PulG
MKSIKNQKGQSLLELLVAILILVMVVTATITLIVTSINAGRASRDKLLATNLAREGIEIVRNIRDSNWVDPASPAPNWDEGLTGTNPATPYIYYAVPAILYYDSPDTQVLLYNDGYVQGSGVPGSATNFFRLLYLDPICNNATDQEMIAAKGENVDCGDPGSSVEAYPDKVGVRVISEVHWPFETSNKQIIIEDRLYDWQVL